jgi:ubiquinone biosynthesis monooxygenase Coq7
MSPPRPPYLPGDPLPAVEAERMIRVDHAGEYGAVRIYDGQLAVTGRGRTRDEIRRMAEQEKRHLGEFEELVRARRVRPTLLQPLWHLTGFALGAASALLGSRAAMACTVAVAAPSANPARCHSGSNAVGRTRRWAIRSPKARR